MNAHHERRTEEEERAMIERVAEAAAIKAVQKFSDLTPWDMSTKEGREHARATIIHADLMRSGCDTIKKTGASMAIRGVFWIIMVSTVFGLLYMIGIDPAKMKILNGK